MKIREARPDDKNLVLKFCNNTFSWGDYIHNVWNYWLDEGSLFVIEQNLPLGICHAFYSNNQVWIEGVRIDNSFRRQHLASKLITHVESIANKKGLHSSFMLVDTKNFPSISMAKNLNYKILETWRFYSLIPKFTRNHNIKFGNILKRNFPTHYVKSWRWLPIDDIVLESLANDNKIIYSCKENNISYAILTDSEHFEKTLIVTLHAGAEINTYDLISYVQDFGFKNDYNKIQLLTKDILPKFRNLDDRLSFYLMRKILH